MAKEAGLWPSLPPGKKRHTVKLDHRLRKFFNTMMRHVKVNYLDKADVMGHKSPAPNESSYEKYIEEDFERFSEYQKIIPFLTIDDNERQKLVIAPQEREISESAQKDTLISDLTAILESLEEVD